MRLLSALSAFILAMSHRHRAFSPLFAPLLRLTAATVLAGTVMLQAHQPTWAQSPTPAADGNAEVETLENPTTDDAAPVAGANGDFPWWPWILAFPALGAALWWLLRNPRAQTTESALPSEPQTGEPTEAVTTETSDHAQEQGTAVDGGTLDEAQAPTSAIRRVILIPRSSETAYAYWELPAAEVEALTPAGYSLSLKLHDVTDGASAEPPTTTLPCPAAAMGDLHLSLPQADRDYWVDLGYEDDTATWHSLATSAPVHAPAHFSRAEADIDPPTPAATVTPVTPATTTEPASSADLSLAPEESRVAAAAIPRPSAPAPRATLTVQTCRSAEAHWEISPEQVADLRIGNRRLTVRLYDVTELPGSFASNPNRVQEFEAELISQGSLALPIAIDDRDYLVEVGYLTGSGQWHVLAKSSPVRVPACDDEP